MKDIKKIAKEQGQYIGIWINYYDPLVIEEAKVAGFDFVRLDNEYMAFSYEQLTQMIRTANLLDITCLIRIRNLDDIPALLTAGADGLIVPNCDSYEKAKKAADLMKYYPVGERGMNLGARAVLLSGMSREEYLAKANDMITLTVQIENANIADEELDRILSIEGIDLVSSGRNDISQSLGIPGQKNDPRVLAFEDKVIKSALAHGKMPSILVSSKEELERIKAKDVHIFTVARDAALLEKAMKSVVDSYK